MKAIIIATLALALAGLPAAQAQESTLGEIVNGMIDRMLDGPPPESEETIIDFARRHNVNFAYDELLIMVPCAELEELRDVLQPNALLPYALLCNNKSPHETFGVMCVHLDLIEPNESYRQECRAKVLAIGEAREEGRRLAAERERLWEEMQNAGREPARRIGELCDAANTGPGRWQAAYDKHRDCRIACDRLHPDDRPPDNPGCRCPKTKAELEAVEAAGKRKFEARSKEIAQLRRAWVREKAAAQRRWNDFSKADNRGGDIVPLVKEAPSGRVFGC